METTQSVKTDATILVKIADKLMEAQREIDEMVLQFALGKAEARDKFEETKREFRTRVSEFKTTSLVDQVTDTSKKLKGLLEELELQLDLGTVDSKDRFEEQRKKIETAFENVRSEVKRIKGALWDKEQFDHEFEKFKLKLEILRLRFALKKFEVRDSFKGSMYEVKKKIERTASKLSGNLSVEKGLTEVKKEVRDIYKSLRKAVKSI